MNGGMYGSQPMRYGQQQYGQQRGQYGGWSNPYWRPEPMQQTQAPQPTALGGRPISNPPSMVQHYMAVQQALAALGQQQTAANQANMRQGYEDSAGGV